jgi:DNA-binding transcriptional MerR regulator
VSVKRPAALDAAVPRAKPRVALDAAVPRAKPRLASQALPAQEAAAADAVPAREAAARAGVSPATLCRWVRAGLVPSYRGRWTSAAVAQARMIARMRERGHSLAELRRAVAAGRLAFGFIDALLADAGEDGLPLAQAAREVGLEPALIERIVATAGAQLEFERIGAIKLKGFTEPTELFLARRRGHQGEGAGEAGARAKPGRSERE